MIIIFIKGAGLKHFNDPQKILYIMIYLLFQMIWLKMKIDLLLNLKISPKLLHVLLSIHFHFDTSHFLHIH
jgi:hypothetical protein